MEQLSCKELSLRIKLINSNNCCTLAEILTSIDEETLKTLAMQRVQELILNPESRSLTVFPCPGVLADTKDTPPNTVVNQSWLRQSSTSDDGKIAVFKAYH